jgi:ribosomal protein S16
MVVIRLNPSAPRASVFNASSRIRAPACRFIESVGFYNPIAAESDEALRLAAIASRSTGSGARLSRCVPAWDWAR